MRWKIRQETMMDEEIKNRIDALLAEKLTKEKKVQEARESREKKEDLFLNQFIEARESIVKPAMEEIKEYLSKQGLSSVIETKEQDHSRQARTSASITIRFTMKYEGYRQPHEYPNLSVIADVAKQNIRFTESTIGPNHGGHSGTAGECALNQLTKEFIHKKIMKVLEAII